MSFADSAEPFCSQRYVQRGAAITLLLIIHIAAIGLLLTAKEATEQLPRGMREIIISFPVFRPKPPPRQTKRDNRRAEARARSVPNYRPPSDLAPPAAQPDLSGVGRALFDCDPANMADMDREQRAGCQAMAAAPGAPEIGMPKKSHAVQTARWMHELAIKHSRVLVPCLSFYQGRQPLGSAKVNQGVMVDMVCVAKGLLNGFGEAK